MKVDFKLRRAGDVTIIDITGRLTLGEPVTNFRDTISTISAEGTEKVILNLQGLDYIDSSGIGELIHTSKLVSVRLINVPKRVADLLRLTNCYALFDVRQDEQTAITSFP